MTVRSDPRAYLAQEARALSMRLPRLEPYASSVPGAAAAQVTTKALAAIGRFVQVTRERLLGRLARYLARLKAGHPVEQMQAELTAIRLSVVAHLSDVDVFADALTQRSEAGTGSWLAGLDALAEDALRPITAEAPPLITYLDRGLGAAIRRARTRLASGEPNPVAIIRVPRERMVGMGVASSIAHEVGHQAAALLDLLPGARSSLAWDPWRRWASEIVADLWSVARVGPAAPLGLMSVLNVPRYFLFRSGDTDPHPVPWVRFNLSCALADALYPDPQWRRLATTWARLHPLESAPPRRQAEIGRLMSELPEVVAALSTLSKAVRDPVLQPRRLRTIRITRALPCRAAAALAQARLDGRLDAGEETRRLDALLSRWALMRAFGVATNGRNQGERDARKRDEEEGARACACGRR